MYMLSIQWTAGGEYGNATSYGPTDTLHQSIRNAEEIMQRINTRPVSIDIFEIEDALCWFDRRKHVASLRTVK